MPKLPKQQPTGVRIQKVLAAAGVASRRGAEDLVRAGRVTVNGGKAVLGTRVEPAKDVIAVDGERLPTDPTRRYLILNKPAGFITTRSDPQGRPTVLDLVAARERIFPVGRLDADTEGLLLLTNDGDLAHRLAHPSFGIDKVYVAEVEGALAPAEFTRLTSEGVRIDAGRKAKAAKIRRLATVGGRRPRTTVEITVHEGRKHVVRKMLGALGHPVRRLVRTGFGPLRLGRLGSGRYRELSPREVAALYRAVGL